MEITQQAPSGGLQIVQSYGEQGFRVSGNRYRGSIIILPDSTVRWPADDIADITLSSLTPVIEAAPAIEVLIVGCGRVSALLPLTLREVLRSKDIGVEAMDTGAACRTYNVLAGESRRVAAALIGL